MKNTGTPRGRRRLTTRVSREAKAKASVHGEEAKDGIISVFCQFKQVCPCQPEDAEMLRTQHPSTYQHRGRGWGGG